LKNIARPMRVYRVRTGTQVPASPGLRTALMQSSALALPDKPSVAVLPFANMTSDPEQEFLADGIAEDVITALSRYPSLFVIARNSSFTYKGRAVDVKQVGRELGVRYVLEGGLRKAGNRIRVTAQLVEAESGKHVWAERYDRDLADIFALQDEITEAVTIAVAPAIADAEQHRALRKPPGSLDAWAAYQRGLWHLSKASAEDNALAEKFFQRAIDLDPIFAGGYKGLAAALNRAGVMFQTRDLAEAQSAEEAGAARGRARWRRCGSPLPPCDCAQHARRSSGGAGRSRAGPGNKSEPGRCTWSARGGADLLGATERRARGTQNMHPARPPRAVSGASVGPRGGGSLLLP